MFGGDNCELTEAPLDEIHVVKSLRHTSGGIKTATLTSTAELISTDDTENFPKTIEYIGDLNK